MVFYVQVSGKMMRVMKLVMMATPWMKMPVAKTAVIMSVVMDFWGLARAVMMAMISLMISVMTADRVVVVMVSFKRGKSVMTAIGSTRMFV